jgi:hypothetical protein
MDFQKKTPKKVMELLNANNVEYLDINYYAFPETFASTTGPKGGIGGAALVDPQFVLDLIREVKK